MHRSEMFHRLAGRCFCRIMLMIWNLRDAIHKPKETAVVFVAHPDDEVLFFHLFLKTQHPYVVVLSGGSSLFRTISFIKVMNEYGLRHRIYDLGTDEYDYEKITKRIKRILKSGNYTVCATHNQAGEYGHEMHKLVHKAVKSTVPFQTLCPVSVNEVEKYPMQESDYLYKVSVFRRLYTSELFVLDIWQNWLKNEKLEVIEK